MDNEKIIQVKKLLHDYEAKNIQAVCSCDYDELAQEIVKLFAIPDVSDNEVAVCANCGQPEHKHSSVTKLCPDRFAHFKQTDC